MNESGRIDEQKDKNSQPITIEIAGGKKFSATRSEESGVYFFDSLNTYEGNTIQNYTKVAVALSKQKREPIKFLFSGQYVTIDASKEGVITFLTDAKWVSEMVEKVLFPRMKRRKDFLTSWLTKNKVRVMELVNKISNGDLEFRPFDNPAEMETYLEAVLTAAWDIGSFKQEKGSAFREYAESIRLLASDLDMESSEAEVGFDDYDEALLFTLRLVYGLSKSK